MSEFDPCATCKVPGQVEAASEAWQTRSTTFLQKNAFVLETAQGALESTKFRQTIEASGYLDTEPGFMDTLDRVVTFASRTIELRQRQRDDLLECIDELPHALQSREISNCGRKKQCAKLWLISRCLLDLHTKDQEAAAFTNYVWDELHLELDLPE